VRFNRGSFFSGLAGVLVGVVVMAALPALAGDGDYMVLGVKNNARRATKLIGKSGMEIRSSKNIPLRLYSPEGVPPLMVTDDALVADLNADLVDGSHAGDLVRVAHAETNDVDEATVFGGNHYGYLLTTDIVAPSAGLLYVVGSAESFLSGVGPAGDTYTCDIRVNTNTVLGTARDVRVDFVDTSSTYADEGNCSTNGVKEVTTAGTYTVDLVVFSRNLSVPQALFGAASLQVLFVPFGADGTQPDL
jgi:hypothetical protein